MIKKFSVCLCAIMTAISVMPVYAAQNSESLLTHPQQIQQFDEESYNAVLPKTVELKSKKTSYVYTGKIIKPAVVVKDAKGKTVNKKNYEVDYSGAGKNVGSYSVKVTFNNGGYSGSKILDYTIVPKAPSITSFTASSAASLTVKWKKPSAVTIDGYKVQISANKNFTNIVAEKKLAVSLSQTNFDNLNQNTTYYARVYAYKTVNGKEIVSDWSSVKNGKTKKDKNSSTSAEDKLTFDSVVNRISFNGKNLYSYSFSQFSDVLKLKSKTSVSGIRSGDSTGRPSELFLTPDNKAVGITRKMEGNTYADYSFADSQDHSIFYYKYWFSDYTWFGVTSVEKNTGYLVDNKLYLHADPVMKSDSFAKKGVEATMEELCPGLYKKLKNNVPYSTKYCTVTKKTTSSSTEILIRFDKKRWVEIKEWMYAPGVRTTAMGVGVSK